MEEEKMEEKTEEKTEEKMEETKDDKLYSQLQNLMGLHLYQ